MGVLLYIGIPVAIAILGGLAFGIKERKPKSVESGIDDFSRTIQALSHSSKPSKERQISDE